MNLGIASSLLALGTAQALNIPAAIEIDGGPLGLLEVSGGIDGYGYVVSPPPNGAKTDGAEVGSIAIQLQKTTGVLQYTIEIDNGNAVILGFQPSQITFNQFTNGPVYAAYATIAPPDSPVTVSAGQLGSLEGREAAYEWYNVSQIVTANFVVENAQSRGVSANYTKGTLSATVTYGDGYHSGVFNYVQALGTYNFDANNVLNVYYGRNLGTTGANTYAYFNSRTGRGNAIVNSQIRGFYYSYTNGNLNLKPELQFQYTKANHRIGIDQPGSNFGADLLADSTPGGKPYCYGDKGTGRSTFVGTFEAGLGLNLIKRSSFVYNRKIQ